MLEDWGHLYHPKWYSFIVSSVVDLTAQHTIISNTFTFIPWKIPFRRKTPPPPRISDEFWGLMMRHKSIRWNWSLVWSNCSVRVDFRVETSNYRLHTNLGQLITRTGLTCFWQSYDITENHLSRSVNEVVYIVEQCHFHFVFIVAPGKTKTEIILMSAAKRCSSKSCFRLRCWEVGNADMSCGFPVLGLVYAYKRLH